MPKKPSKEKEDLVITPAGPMPRERVHGVGPGEAVRINESGKMVIEPREGSPTAEEATDDLVLTPGGYRPRSVVHAIEPDHALRLTDDGHLQKLHPSGEILADFGQIRSRPAGTPLMPGNVALMTKEVPKLGHGWIAYAGWTNNTGNPVRVFQARSYVPPEPTTKKNQTIFLFIGIQDSSMILQPVLQWGKSAAGGGKYWSVACWYADGQGGHAVYTKLVQVRPLANLLPGMNIADVLPNGKFNYNCYFLDPDGAPSLEIKNVPELTWCNVTLEAYNVGSCSEYPEGTVRFDELGIGILHLSKINWIRYTPITDCGQDVTINNYYNNVGSVTIRCSPGV